MASIAAFQLSRIVIEPSAVFFSSDEKKSQYDFSIILFSNKKEKKKKSDKTALASALRRLDKLKDESFFCMPKIPCTSSQSIGRGRE